jgi:hypothetical protein
MKQIIQNAINFLENIDYRFPPELFFDYTAILSQIIDGYNDPYEPESVTYKLDVIGYGHGVDEIVKKFLGFLKDNNLIKDFKIIEMMAPNKPTEGDGLEKEMKFEIFINWENNDVCKLFDYVSTESYKSELYGDKKSKSIIAKYILKKAQEFDNDEITLKIPDFSLEDVRFINVEHLDHIRLMKTLREFEEEKIIKINWATYSVEKTNVIERVRLSVLDKKKLKEEVDQKTNECAKPIESKNKQKTHTNHKTIYLIEYKNRKVVLKDVDNCKEYILSKPQFNETGDLFMCYIINNPDKKIRKEAIEKYNGKKIPTGFHQLLNNLGFKGEIKKIFFPGVSNNSVMFKNNVTKKDVVDLEIDEEKLKKQIRELINDNKP